MAWCLLGQRENIALDSIRGWRCRNATLGRSTNV